MGDRDGPNGWLIGVVGSGTMGAGIAQVALEAGHEVAIYDVDAEATRGGRQRIKDGLRRRMTKLGIDEDDQAAWLGERLSRMREITSIDGLAVEADLVIEAAIEDLELKRTLFRRLDESSSPETLLATNTSALSIEAISAATAHPERVLGLHFFNPAPVMKLVEVVAGSNTANEVATLATEAVTTWGKTPIRSSDAPGFVVNRVNRPFTLEALRMLDEDEASVEQIDRAIVDAGFPMGPFALMDLIGIDVNLAVATSLYERFDREPRFQPSATQARLAEEGRFGRKAGEGFYRYAADGAPLGPGRGFQRRPASAPGAAAIVERIVLAVVNEAYFALGERVATRADIDLALRLGAGHPRGPFEQAKLLGGRSAVLSGLEALSERLGPRFTPAPALIAAS
ncbi:MAG: 3-hydroxybutyryl-CoA dehydrogenase [Chloroflexi bacterium]|nr:MAG: 3-hydroxybutyryl-CoA dehydrogenase [Chloroflexota bacterium]